MRPKTIRKLIAASFALAFSISRLFSAEPITIEKCVAIALENSKTIKISNSKVKSADSREAELEAGGLPSLSLTAGYTRLSDIDPFAMTFMGKEYVLAPSILDNYSMKASAVQPIYTGNRISSSVEAAKYNFEALKNDLERDKFQLILDVKTAYWNLFKAYRQKKSIEDNLEQTKAHLVNTENMRNSGLATDNDVLKVKVSIKNIEFSLIDADNSVELAQIALNGAMGENVSKRYEIPDNIEAENQDLPNIDNLLATSKAQRPEFKAYENRIKSAKSSVETSLSSWYPQINAFADYIYADPNSRLQPAQDKFKATWDAGINLSFTLWNWQTTSRQTEQAEASLLQNKLNLEQFKDNVEIEINTNLLNCAKAKEKINLCQETITQALENLRVTQEQYKNGNALNSDLLDAETSLRQAKINLASSLADYQIALAKLDKSIGK